MFEKSFLVSICFNSALFRMHQNALGNEDIVKDFVKHQKPLVNYVERKN